MTKQEFTFKKRDKAGLLIKLRSFFDSLDDNTEYVMTIDKVRKKRSLDANSYFWLLVDKLATLNGLPSKTEIYRDYVKEIGGNNKTICAKTCDVDTIIADWNAKGLGWIAETFDSQIDGCTNIRLYRGSSTYDTAQMARLIDLCVQDCVACGIDVATPAERALLLEEWQPK